MHEPKFVKKLKLPSLERFTSTKKDVSPYDVFYAWVKRKMDGEVGQKVNVSASWVSPSDDKALLELNIKWAQKVHKMTRRAAEASVGWLHLDIGPAAFNPDMVLMPESGFVYLREDLFDER
jgi:hypothetical protein